MIFLVDRIFNLYSTLILIYVLMSWFPGAYQTKLGQWLGKIVEPYLSLLNFIPPIAGLSFAPVVALIVLQPVEWGVDFILGLLGLY